MDGSVDFDAAQKQLSAAWDKIDDANVAASPDTLVKLNEIIRGQVGFKYILVTGILAKATNPDAHPRSLQKGSGIDGAYDARSLCHKVVVPFEKTKGNLFGLSNEPLVGKPTRHPMHDKTNPQLRSKRLASILHDVLEEAHTASPEHVEEMLVSILRIGKTIAESQVPAVVDVDTNLRHVTSFVKKFLEQTSGGSRLVAVTGAFATLLSHEYAVKVYNTNAADAFAKTTGDIEVFDKEADQLISAYECKQRPLNLDDVKHGIRKARMSNVPEYCFVYSAGLEKEQDILDAIALCDDLDVVLVEIHAASPYWIAMLNPERRAKFGDVVTTILRSMKRADVANDAAALWNSLE